MGYCVPLGIPHSEFLSWDPDDQDKALAYVRAKESVCEGCGTREEDWADDRLAFLSETRRCLGCELIEMERENWDPEEKGIKIFLVRNRHEDD